MTSTLFICECAGKYERCASCYVHSQHIETALCVRCEWCWAARRNVRCVPVKEEKTE